MPALCSLLDAGVDDYLTKPFGFAELLARHAGKVVTHRQLLIEVWGPHSAEENRYLRVHMTHLRRKLQPSSGAARLFHKEAGVGYRLECPDASDSP